MRLLKIAVLGFFAVVAVAAGVFVAALTVVLGFLAAVARQLSGRPPQATRRPVRPHGTRRPMKTINAGDVTVSDVATDTATQTIERV